MLRAMRMTLLCIGVGMMPLAWAQAPDMTPAAPQLVTPAPATVVAPTPPEAPTLATDLPQAQPGRTSSPASEPGLWRLSVDEWARPQDAASVLALKPLRQAVEALVESEAARLLIRYPGGEEGGLYAAQIRDWLVALGLSSSRIEVQPGSRSDELIDIQLEPESGT